MTIKTVSWPTHSEDEISAVNKVLASGCTNYWTGSECREFEKEFAKFIGTRYAVALMNGTVALEAALLALDIGPDDEVITSCRTFIASASCIVMRGAIPVLADIDPITQNITVETIKACLTPRTKAIIVVHLAGWPADMERISTFAQEHKLKVIEDCAQAHGATLNNKVVGSFGDIAAFSFCQDKILTTGGEGGMITTNNERLWQTIWSFKDHGKNYKKVYEHRHPPGFRWLHDSFGTNWRMTEMQAAIGRQQLKKLPQWLQIRKRNADILTSAWQALSAFRLTQPPQYINHAYYKYYVFVRPEKLNPDWSRDRILQEINAQGVACFIGSCSDIYLEQAFKTIQSPLTAPNFTAKSLGETSLMFLVHPTLTEEDMQNTATIVTNIMLVASKPRP